MSYFLGISPWLLMDSSIIKFLFLYICSDGARWIYHWESFISGTIHSCPTHGVYLLQKGYPWKKREIPFFINLDRRRKGGKEVEYIFPIGMKNIGQHKIIICFSMVKKLFLEISQNSQEKSCARVSFSIKLQAWGSYRTSPGDCFSLCFNHFQKKQMTVT